MLLENLELGRMVEIFVEREGYRYHLTSKVEDANERRLCVSLIAARGRAFQFKNTDEISIIYKDTEQMWQWDMVKGSVIKLEDTVVHAFAIHDKGHSFNRRNAYRISLEENVEIGFYVINEGTKRSADLPAPGEFEGGIADVTIDGKLYPYPKLLAKPEFSQGVVRDISENGLGICTNLTLKDEDSFFLYIPTTYGKLLTKAQVIRQMDLNPVSNKYRNYYGCILKQADKRLIRYIYDVQRERIRNQKEKQEEDEMLKEAALRRKEMEADKQE